MARIIGGTILNKWNGVPVDVKEWHIQNAVESAILCGSVGYCLSGDLMVVASCRQPSDAPAYYEVFITKVRESGQAMA
ncbi:MAG TPA: hypothetical protein PKA10_12200 [Selenomonadales bacterium]|nr:hypothetical protein [Selenomonadales bacterium]